jgi:2-phosphoglycolate phosphatase
LIAAVFFDLDGTLADTAPDLGNALNRLRGEHGLPPLPLAVLRPHTSSGVRGMLRAGFGIAPGDAGYEALRDHYLDLYEAALCEETQLFPGIAQVLEGLEARGIAWGVVTNKTTRFARPLMQRMGLLKRMSCLVCGDTTAAAKPSPLPLRHAAMLTGVAAADCLYVGDDRRDVEAGRAAGMRTIAVRWGYLGIDEPIEAWGADLLLDSPAELRRYLGL